MINIYRWNWILTLALFTLIALSTAGPYNLGSTGFLWTLIFILVLLLASILSYIICLIYYVITRINTKKFLTSTILFLIVIYVIYEVVNILNLQSL